MPDPELLLTPQQAVEVFGTTELAKPEAIHGEPFVTANGVELQFGATTLGLAYSSAPAGDAELRVTGNTLMHSNADPRGCDAAECTVSVCGLAQFALSNDRRRGYNCAAANTLLGRGERPAFVITPTNNNVVFLSDADSYENVTAQDEYTQEQTLFGKVRAASTLVVSEHDIPEGADGIDVLMNGADSSLAVESTEVEGTRYILVSCSSRPNLGDRSPNEQIVRRGYEAILDRHGLEGAARQRAINEAQFEIHIGYSASLENFAHRVGVPELQVPEALQDANLARLTPEQQALLSGPSRYALTLLKKNGLIDHDTGEIVGRLTPKVVMDDQYPGALEHGEIYPEFEARSGIDAPYTNGGCPGDGQLCHVHYPKITQRTLVTQLEAIGVRPEHIFYDNSRAVDPASEENRLASNRRFQLAGIPANRTPRSVNGVSVSFGRVAQLGA